MTKGSVWIVYLQDFSVENSGAARKFFRNFFLDEKHPGRKIIILVRTSRTGRKSKFSCPLSTMESISKKTKKMEKHLKRAATLSKEIKALKKIKSEENMKEIAESEVNPYYKTHTYETTSEEDEVPPHTRDEENNGWADELEKRFCSRELDTGWSRNDARFRSWWDIWNKDTTDEESEESEDYPNFPVGLPDLNDSGAEEILHDDGCQPWMGDE